MAEYSISPEIITSSLNELKIIQRWTEEIGKNSEKPVVVLIGGWAVDSYNSWYGSIDIDLVTKSDVRSELKYYLRTEHGYLESINELQMPSGIEKNTDEGAIIIDFIPKGRDNPFEGDTNPFNFSIIDDHVIQKSIRNACKIYVPTRTILLFLKLKAAWDRNYRIKHNTSQDPDWDKSKLIKDNADILSLLDPEFGGMDIDLDELGTLFERYPFLTQTLFKIKDNSESRERYKRLEKTEIFKIFEVIENYFSVE